MKIMGHSKKLITMEFVSVLREYMKELSLFKSIFLTVKYITSQLKHYVNWQR